MRKEIIKCDKCGVDLDYEHSGQENNHFYTLTKEHIRGWASIDYLFGADSTYQICMKCFDLLGLKEKNAFTNTNPKE
jgi:hypothetical protein